MKSIVLKTWIVVALARYESMQQIMYVQYVPTCIAFIRTWRPLRTQFPNVRLYLTKLQYFYIREYMQLASAYIHSACEVITHASWINPPYRWFTHLSQRESSTWRLKRKTVHVYYRKITKPDMDIYMYAQTHRNRNGPTGFRELGGTCMYDVYAPAAIYIMRIW
jgi:hypothetical protein